MKAKVKCIICNKTSYDQLIRINPKGDNRKMYAHKSCLTEEDFKFYQNRKKMSK